MLMTWSSLIISDCEALEGNLTQDMAILSSYLYKSKLKLSATKIVSAFFYLYNKEAQCELNTFVNGQTLPFCVESTYLGIKLDRAITFCRQLVSLRKKLTSRVGLISRLGGSCWDADATVLRTVTLALVHSTAEYFPPVWYRSAHTCLIDKPINDALCIVTGCLRPTPTATFLSYQTSNQLSFAAKKPNCL